MSISFRTRLKFELPPCQKIGVPQNVHKTDPTMGTSSGSPSLLTHSVIRAARGQTCGEALTDAVVRSSTQIGHLRHQMKRNDK